MTQRLLSIPLPLLLVLCLAGCERSASGIPSRTVTGPSTDEAAKTDKSIRILSGQLVYDSSISRGPLIDLKGTRNFRLSSTFEGPFGPVGSCSPCAPGDRVHLDSIAVGSDVRGTATLQGKTYDRIGGGGNFDPGMLLDIRGDGFLAPPFTEATTAEMSAPFTFSGIFSYYPDGPSMPNVSETLTGSGIATVRLRKVAFGSDLPVWMVDTAVFDFSK